MMFFVFFNGFFTVDADEIRRLGKRFKKLDLDHSGSLSVEEFMSLPQLQQNPLVQRVIDIFDTDGNGEVDFRGDRRVTRSALVLMMFARHERLNTLNGVSNSALRTQCCTNPVHFAEFIEGVSQFSVKGDKEQKLQCEYNEQNKL